MTTTNVAAPASNNGTTARAAKSLSQLWQVPAFLMGLAGLAFMAILSPLATRAEEDSLDRELTTIRRALEKSGAIAAETVALAEIVVGRATSQGQRVGEAHFLLGSAYLRRAEHAPPPRPRTELDKSGLHLELADLRGVPETDVARLTYLRGKLAFLGNGDMPRTIELLSKSLPGGAEDPFEGYALLVKAHLSGPAPNLDAALAANLKQMEFCDDDVLLAQARLARGELLLKKPARAEAIRVLEAIGAKAPKHIRKQARLYQAKAAMDEGLWGRAIPWWEELQAIPEATATDKARIHYYLGLCWLNFEPPNHEKDAVDAWKQAQIHGGEEAQAAALRLAELRLNAGREPAAALAHFRDALEKVSSIKEYQNSLVPLSEARALLETACQTFEEREETDNFLLAAELYKKVAAPGVAEERIGQAAQAKALFLLAQMEKPQADPGNIMVQARTAFHKAALAFDQAAEMRPPADRIDVLWRCIECYRGAEKPLEAIAVLKRFVVLPASSQRKAEAWFTLAEIQLPVNPAEAAESYKRSVEFDNPTFTARALLQLADLAIAQKQPNDARDVLLQIIHPPLQNPIADRPSHQLAMLKLANLYFNQSQFDKAALQCHELLKQYPGNSQAFVARDLLGKSYRKQADNAREKSNSKSQDAALAQQQELYRRQTQEFMEKARDAYQQLADDLEAKALEKSLPPAEASLRRNVHLDVADCYFALPNGFDQAFKGYTLVFERFKKDKEGFWAGVSIGNCFWRALDPKHQSMVEMQTIREIAEAAVDHCLRHIDDYEQTGAFRPPANKEECRTFLENTRIQLSRTVKSR